MIVFGSGKKLSGRRAEGPSFGEIVGQAEFKQALLATAANDAIDGLLVRGEKGTAKSTAVRALAELLPDQRAVADCPFGCPPTAQSRQCADCRERSDPPVEERPVPLVTLPLGATRDRVVGTLSIGDALDGEQTFEPGLLARANRGILYVDEVNLLDDHLVDVLLDAAASGVNRVERDGVSVVHPAEFTVIGTMNPEEGDLRPQLRDRFALQATVTGCADVDDRMAIIEQALDPDEAATADEESTDAVARRLHAARDRLPDVSLPHDLAAKIATLCRDAGLDGHRGDIATARAARTLAALDGRDRVLEADVRRAAELAVPHRLQARPFEDAPDPDEVLDEHFADGTDEGGGDQGSDAESRGGEPDETPADDAPGAEEAGTDGTGDADDERSGETSSQSGPADRESTAESGGESASEPEQPVPEPGEGADGDRLPAGDTADASDGGGDVDAGADGDESETATPVVPGQERARIGNASAPDIQPDTGGCPDGGGSGATATPSVDNEGPRVRTSGAEGSGRLDAGASVRAAARRGRTAVERRDLRQSVRAGEASTLVLFVVDASASMRPAMRAAKGTVMALLEDSYQQRDEVGFVAVAGERAEVVLPPTDSASHAARHLKDLPTGDRTPLPDGLRTAVEVLDRADPDCSVVVLVTDGRANVADGSPTAATREAAALLAERDVRLLAVDADSEGRAGVLDDVVEITDGRRVPLGALSAERVDAAAGTPSSTEL